MLLHAEVHSEICAFQNNAHEDCNRSLLAAVGHGKRTEYLVMVEPGMGPVGLATLDCPQTFTDEGTVQVPQKRHKAPGMQLCTQDHS